MTVSGIVQNGVVVLENGCSLPDGTRVEVQLPRPALSTETKPTLSEMLLRHAGTVDDLPVDMAAQHDHYIHGTPKR